jgi:hypothetical protein
LKEVKPFFNLKIILKKNTAFESFKSTAIRGNVIKFGKFCENKSAVKQSITETRH